MKTQGARMRPSRPSHRAGAAMILLLVLLTILLAAVAFSVDVGLMTVLRAEVQNAVDAGALAAALTLQDDPDAISEAEDAARQFVRANRVGMAALVPTDAIDVEHGEFDSDANTFTATDVSPNAVRVFARQDNERHLFAGVLGHHTYGVPASATASSASVPLDVMLVLDLSGSMADEGRIQALWNAVPLFIDMMQDMSGDDQVGVMGLAANPKTYDPVTMGHTGVKYVSGLHPTADHYVGVLEAPLTTNFSYLRNTVLSSANLPAGKYPPGWTGTGAAIGDAAHYLAYGAQSRADAKKMMVLMSDGHANKPTFNPNGYARSMATYAASHDVMIYTISLGNDADLTLMRRIATIGGGEHFDATGSGAAALTARLKEAFKQTAAAIKRVQLVR